MTSRIEVVKERDREFFVQGKDSITNKFGADYAWSVAESAIRSKPTRMIMPITQLMLFLRLENHIINQRTMEPDGSQLLQMGKTRVYFLTARHPLVQRPG